MIRILGGASLVSRNGSGVRAWAPGRLVNMSLDSCQSPEPFTSRAGRALEAEVDLSGVVREAIAPLEQET